MRYIYLNDNSQRQIIETENISDLINIAKNCKKRKIERFKEWYDNYFEYPTIIKFNKKGVCIKFFTICSHSRGKYPDYTFSTQRQFTKI